MTRLAIFIKQCKPFGLIDSIASAMISRARVNSSASR